jgi:hypothetical protein
MALRTDEEFVFRFHIIPQAELLPLHSTINHIKFSEVGQFTLIAIRPPILVGT